MFKNFKTIAFLIFILSLEIFAGDIRFCFITDGSRYTNEYNATPTMVAVKTCYIPEYTNGLFGGFVKLFTDNGTYDSRYYMPEFLMRPPGNYSWRLELIEYNLIGEEVKSKRIVNFTVAFAVTGDYNFPGGDIVIDNHTFQAGTYVSKVPSEVMNLTAIDQEYNNLMKAWSQSSRWRRSRNNWMELQVYSRNCSYTVLSDDNLVRIRGYMTTIPNWPAATPRNLNFNSSNQGYLTINWTEHPNASVTQYQIWRKTNTESPALIATVNRGTTSYVDTRFRVNGGSTVYYDVRGYYPPEYTSSYEAWVGTTGLDTQIDKKVVIDEEDPKTFTLNNYPNPFNPTTKVEFDLPVSGYTTLKVYNALGKEIATLVDGYKNSGKYSAEFNAADLSSGLYLCQLKSGNFVQNKKMLLIK